MINHNALMTQRAMASRTVFVIPADAGTAACSVNPLWRAPGLPLNELQDRLLGLLAAPANLARNCRWSGSRMRPGVLSEDRRALWLRLGRRHRRLRGIRQAMLDGSAAEKPASWLGGGCPGCLATAHHVTNLLWVGVRPDLGGRCQRWRPLKADEDHEADAGCGTLTVHSNPFSSSDAELLLDYFEPSTQRVRFRRLHVSGFSPAGRANANAGRTATLAVLVAGPAGGGLHAVVSLADAGTTLASEKLSHVEKAEQQSAEPCAASHKPQPSAALVAAAAASSIAKNASTQWCQSQPQPPVLQVPDAAATLHSDARRRGDLFRRNRLISVGPTRLANQRQFYYAALTRRESLRPLKGFLRWSRPAVATATECRQLVTMAIKAHVGLSERRSSLLVVRHRVLDGGDHQAGKLVMEESFEYERTFQS
uniref:Uncharacterized protein n=1 Tax=Macrostomum lignano TaxID=282301 RepID=A0A1I8JPR6_9PLAT